MWVIVKYFFDLSFWLKFRFEWTSPRKDIIFLFINLLVQFCFRTNWSLLLYIQSSSCASFSCSIGIAKGSTIPSKLRSTKRARDLFQQIKRTSNLPGRSWCKCKRLGMSLWGLFSLVFLSWIFPCFTKIDLPNVHCAYTNWILQK